MEEAVEVPSGCRCAEDSGYLENIHGPQGTPEVIITTPIRTSHINEGLSLDEHDYHGRDEEKTKNKDAKDDTTSELLYTDVDEIDQSDAGKQSDRWGTKPEAPDGGWGWVVCFACFIQTLVYDGVFFTFGIIFLELLKEFKTKKETGAWISSFNFAFTMLTGPFISVLCAKFGFRTVAIAGSLLASVGLVVSSFASGVKLLYISYGIVAGFGYGMVYQASLVSVTLYFDRRRTLATGLSLCGNGLGIFILSPLTEWLVQRYAWRGAILIQAGLLLNGIVCGLVYRPLEPSFRADCGFQEQVKNDDYEDFKDNTRSTNVHTYPCALVAEHSKDAAITCLRDANITGNGEELNHVTQLHSSQILSEGPYSESHDDVTKEVKTILGNPVVYTLKRFKMTVINFFTKTFGMALLKDAPFCLYTISSAFYTLSYYVPFLYLPDVAQHAGIDEFRAAWLLSAIGITNIASRLVSGLIGDRQGVNRVLLYSVCVILSGFAVIVTPLCNGFEVLMVVSVAYGIFLGISSTLISVLVADLLGAQDTSQGLGVCNMFSGFSAVIGTPFAGWMYDVTGSYHVPFYVCGAIISASGVMVLAIPCIKTGRHRTK